MFTLELTTFSTTLPKSKILIHYINFKHSFRDHADQSCFRYIISFKCAEPFIYRDTVRNQDVEFMTIYIRGQSFMMHQIRKMIGMVIAVSRGFVYKTEIQKSFESRRVNFVQCLTIHFFSLDGCSKSTRSWIVA